MRLSEDQPLEKLPQVSIREWKELGQDDYRGILALGALVIYGLSIFVALAFRPEYVDRVIQGDTIVLLAMQWYFQHERTKSPDTA